MFSSFISSCTWESRRSLLEISNSRLLRSESSLSGGQSLIDFIHWPSTLPLPSHSLHLIFWVVPHREQVVFLPVPLQEEHATWVEPLQILQEILPSPPHAEHFSRRVNINPF